MRDDLKEVKKEREEEDKDEMIDDHPSTSHSIHQEWSSEKDKELVERFEEFSIKMETFYDRIQANQDTEDLDFGKKKAKKEKDLVSMSPDKAKEEYYQSLARLYSFVNGNLLEELHERRSLILPKPIIQRVGSKKTAFVNFPMICDSLNRNQGDLDEFLRSEFGCVTSIDSNGCLIMRGRFGEERIEAGIRGYVRDYVNCKTCLSKATRIEKRKRLMRLECEICHSIHSLSPIHNGFQATILKRRVTRNAQAIQEGLS